jgi:hypothetical protein
VLLAGSELLVVGTFDPAKGITGTVTGYSPEGARRYTFAGGQPGALPFLPRLVAYHQVRAMQEEDVPDVAAIKELALEHSFVTDHTSLVLTLAAREFTPNSPGDPRMTMDQQCCGNTSGAPSTSASGGGGGGWWPFGRSSSDASSEAMTDADGRNDLGARPTAATGPPVPTSTPAVPGPGPALVVLALIAIALLLRRR